MSWQILIVITVISLSVAVLLQRVLMRSGKINPIAFSAVFQLIVAALLLVPVVLHGFSVTGYTAIWLFALISILGYGFGTIFSAKSLQKIEASTFSVLFATQALWVALVGILILNEQLAAIQLLGIILIFTSVWIITGQKNGLHSKGTILGLITGFFYGIATAAAAYVGRHVDTLTWIMLSFVGSALVSAAMSPKDAMKYKTMFKGRNLLVLLTVCIFYAIGTVAMIFAYKYGTFSVIAPLRQTGIVVTVLLALLFLPPERNHTVRKLTASLLCLVGTVILIP